MAAPQMKFDDGRRRHIRWATRPKIRAAACANRGPGSADKPVTLRGPKSNYAVLRKTLHFRGKPKKAELAFRRGVAQHRGQGALVRKALGTPTV